MTIEDAELDRLIDTAGLLGLTIRPEWRDSVRAHLRFSLRLGTSVGAMPLPDEIDLAPVFIA
jgi:hypothetical protein